MEMQLPENLVQFDKLVEDAYQQEIAIFTLRGERLPSKLSVHDIGPKHLRPRTTRMDVIDSWRSLLQQIKQHVVFTDHVSPMERAFLDIEDIDKKEYRRLQTLVDLLTQTVQNHNRDDSVACRFVTLLEVILSYSDDWTPSVQLAPFWMRQNREVPSPTIAPASFRRRAYRVLVSLPWVPSSSGLLDACSFDEHKLQTNYADAPYALRRNVFWKIREPRPRYDSVNQILDRLKDETDVCISIWSAKEGLGKTTLAAQVASNPSILKVFTVLWLKAGKEECSRPLSYEKYTLLLTDLCGQMSANLHWPEPVDRIEEPGLKQVREQSLMNKARQQMTEYISCEELNILLVIDDLEDSSWISWFRFNENQSIIVTTSQEDLHGVDWSVQLDVMSEGEAIELFLTEANLPANHVLGNTVEVKEIVTRCEFNPLTVRSVARWFHLKQVTAGPVKAIEEILSDLASLTQSERGERSEDDEPEEMDPNMFVFDVLSLMMGPVRNDTNSTSVVFVMCFAALAVVFPHRVPLDAVLLLWEQVLEIEPLASDELRSNGLKSGISLLKHAWFIAEGLVHMGVIHVFDDEDGNPWVEIHHKLYKQFASLMAREMDLKASYEQTVVDWNAAFVATYFSRRIQGNNNKADANSWEYALRRLPQHMLNGKMLPTAETILADQHFFKARIESLGWKKAIELQLSDCVALQARFVDELMGEVSPAFSRTAEMVKGQVVSISNPKIENVSQEIAQILIKIGFLQTELGFYECAIGYFKEVQSLMTAPNDIVAASLYGESICSLKSNNPDIGLQKIRACHEVMEQGADLHVLYTDMLQLVSLALVASCHYMEAVQFYNVICDKLRAEPEKWKLELGCVLHGQARLFLILGDFDKAKAVFLECLQIKEALKEKSRDLASAYTALGDILVELDEAKNAKERYETAIDILDDLDVGDADLDHQLLMGKVLFLRGNYYASSEEFDVAVNLIKESPTFLLDKSAYDVRFIARTFFIRGESQKAVELLKLSLVLTDERPLSLERVSGLTDLAHSLIETGNSSEGLTFLERALEIQITNFGESVSVVDSLRTIGNIHCSLKEYDEAIAMYDKVREILQRVHSEDTGRMADILFDMGDVLDLKGEVDDAIQAFTEFTKVIESSRSADHPEIAKAFQRMGEIEFKRRAIDEAEGHFTKAFAIRKVHNQEVVLAETSHFLGVLARKRRDLNLAHEYLTSALEIRKIHQNAEETGVTLLEIGNVYRMQSDYDSALSVYEKGIEMIDESTDLSQRIDNARGHALVGKGNFEQSLLTFNKFRESRLELYGRDHLFTGVTSRSLGLVYFLLNHVDEALVHLNEFVRVCELQEDEETSETIDYAMAVFLLGELHLHKGKADQAEAVWTVSKEVCEDNGFDKIYPEFFAMVSSRLEEGFEAKPKGTGLFSRLTGDASIMSDPEERRILQQIAFMDD